VFGARHGVFSFESILSFFDLTKELLEIKFDLNRPVDFFHFLGNLLHLLLEISDIGVVVVGPVSDGTEDVGDKLPCLSFLIEFLQLIFIRGYA
jgi:hypothetical protein